jgi:hypothetical protein
LSELPEEIHVNVMAHLDPISQVCLGLTSTTFHSVFLEIYGHGKMWDIKKNPFGLDMQVSVCGEYVLNWYVSPECIFQLSDELKSATLPSRGIES